MFNIVHIYTSQEQSYKHIRMYLYVPWLERAILPKSQGEKQFQDKF